MEKNDVVEVQRISSSAAVIAAANEIKFNTNERVARNAEDISAAASVQDGLKKFGKWFFRSPKKDKQDANEKKKELVMDEHTLTKDELLQRLGTDENNGLSDDVANAKLAKDGYNVLTPPKETPEWLKLLQTQTGFFSLLLWAGAILCYVAFSIDQNEENLILGIVLSAVVLLTGIFSYLQERKSSNLMKSFKNMMADSTETIRNGKVINLESKNLVVGDVIRLKAGNKVPADVRIIECTDDTEVDNSSLTGEADPQKRQAKCTNPSPMETANLMFFGTLVPKGTAKCVVVRTGDNTYMGSIATLATSTENEETPIAKEIKHFVHIVSGVAVFLGVSFFIIGVALGTDLVTALVFMIGIIVANVPEGLLATVTVCLTLTAKQMAKKQVLCKNLESVETLGSTSCICSDKTGTLTQNIMTVAHIVYDMKIWDVESTMGPANFNAEDPSFVSLNRCATLCNTAVFDERSKTDKNNNGVPVAFKETITLGDGTTEKRVMWQTLGDASESAMIKFAQNFWDIMNYRSGSPVIKAIPFNSAQKYQAHVHRMDSPGCKHAVLLKGAPERVVGRCGTALVNGQIVELTPQMAKDLDNLMIQLSKRGMRVLAFAEKLLSEVDYPEGYDFNVDTKNFPLGEPDDLFENEVKVAAASNSPAPSERCKEKLTYLGMMALIDPPRPQVPDAVRRCKSAGIKVIMVTGDHPETAKAISKKVGIIWGDTSDDIADRNENLGLKKGMPGWQDPDFAPAIVVPGWDFTIDTPAEVWDDILAHPQVVFARTSPQQKLVIVENCQKRGHVVAVTGDGVNDSPALKKADIGIAMGIMGTEVSKEAADMILLDDNFASIVNGVESGRLIFDNLKKSIAYTLSSNIPEIAPFLSFIVVQIPLPLSTVLILLIDLGTDMVPAISMAWENPEADIMARNPRDASEDRLVTTKLISYSYLQIGVIQALSGFYTYLTVMSDYGYIPSTLPGLGANDAFGKHMVMCKVRGGAWVNFEGVICPCFNPTADDELLCGAPQPWWTSESVRSNVIDKCQKLGYFYWDRNTRQSYTSNGITMADVDVEESDCVMPARTLYGQNQNVPPNFNIYDASTYFSQDGGLYTGASKILGQPTRESIQAIRNLGCTTNDCNFYYQYVPYAGANSHFYNMKWNAWPVTNDGVRGLGTQVDSGLVFAMQPIGTWTTWSTGVSAKEWSMGHISDVQSTSTSSTNPNRISTNTFGAGYLDMNTDLPWLSTNFLSNAYFFDDMALNLKTTVSAIQAQQAVNPNVNNTIVLRQLARCGIPFAVLDPRSIWSRQPQWVNVRQTILNTGGYTCQPTENGNTLLLNVASREMARNSLANAQCASFVDIVIVQWADLIICKTRWLSLRSQGMRNSILNFALVFETLLAAAVCYILPINSIGTRPLRLTHWFTGLPFSILILLYDETRKYLMRMTSTTKVDSISGRVVRQPGWLESFTYY